MPKADLQPLARFSNRVEDYVRYRPSYPVALLDRLGSAAGLGPAAVVADIGSGTGIFTALLLDRARRVLAVEPNQPMRVAAEAALGGRPNFESRKGRSEATGLPTASVDLITCAQAFHWFEPDEARREFSRILRPGGWCALIWNTQETSGSGFPVGYEELKNRFSIDYARVNQEHQRTPSVLETFFGNNRWTHEEFANVQHLNFDALRGRLLSSSFAPLAGHPHHAPMLEALQALFDRFQQDGTVAMAYRTELFLGQFT